MEILNLSKKVNVWKRSFIYAEQAALQVKFEYMTKSEKKLWIKNLSKDEIEKNVSHLT